LRVPGDKSISHRAAVLGALSEEGFELENFSPAADCASTVRCLGAMGAQVELLDGSRLTIRGGRDRLREPEDVLDAGNSGTTARLLCGLLAGLSGAFAVITGDDSLRRRPMRRVVEPLSAMGARISGREGGNRLPLVVWGTKLSGIRYEMKVPSAQVKSALLLAGLFANSPTSVVEGVKSRDHTEIMFRFLGLPMEARDGVVKVFPCDQVPGRSWRIPGDPSSASFWAAAALLIPGSEVLLEEVCLNPTRTGFFGLMSRCGAELEFRERGLYGGERVGDVLVRHSELSPFEVGPEEVPSMVDELPLLALVATQIPGRSVVRGAGELRVKECDRISAVAEGLRRLGARIEELPDGWEIEGPTALGGGRVRSFGDHRIAMTFSVAGLISEGEVLLDDAGCVRISYPQFFEHMRLLSGVCLDH